MQDLKDVTHDVHYENYRVRCLSELAKYGGGTANNLAHIAHIAADSPERKSLRKDSVLGKSREELEEDHEKILLEKDAEIQKMQAALEQLQAKLYANNK